LWVAPDQYTSITFPVKVVKLLLADHAGYASNPVGGLGREEVSINEDESDEVFLFFNISVG
jgi:hypothetical protein